ncbi:MAG: DUF192 domain-containing protein [Verrucomicrobiota bacterium]
MILRAFVGAFACALLVSGCEKSRPNSPAPTNVVRAAQGVPQPRLPTLKLRVSGKEIVAELAIRDRERMTGMMYRESMGEDEGMLFVFEFPHRAAFWMKNTKVPLSAAYIDPEGVIQEIHDLEPGNLASVEARSDRIQYVLEMNRDWFKRNNIAPGALIVTEKGSFAKVFFGRN